MIQDNFSCNMTALRRYNPMLAEELTKAGDDLSTETRLEEAASGAPTLFFKGVYVHSRRDPEREALRLIESAAGVSASPAHVSSSPKAGAPNSGSEGAIDGETPAIILGFGLGYAASILAEKYPEKPIIIVEKHKYILKKAMEARDLSSFLSRDHLVFVLGGKSEVVSGALSLFDNTSPPLIIRNRALTGLDEEWYTIAEEQINTWKTGAQVNRATQKRFGKRWVRNLSQNLSSIRDIPGISRLMETLAGKIRDHNIPAFLAAAGPTLDEAGPLLAEIQKRCITVAVDTSLRFMQSHGVESDFAVSVDPQYWNYRHLDRTNSAPPAGLWSGPKTRLIAESAVYPPVLRHPFGAMYLCSSFFPLGRFIENRVDPKGELGAGGSVATSAWDFIRLLGAKELWIAGLDLSFPGLRTHFRGAVFEEKVHAESGRFIPPETFNCKALRDGQPFLAKKQDGGAVLTDKRLSLYAAWFENRFREFPEITNLGLNAEGLAISGLRTAGIEELLALPIRRDEIDNLLDEAEKQLREGFFSARTMETRAEKYENAKKTLLQGLLSIKTLAERAAESAKLASARCKMGHLSADEQEKALSSLDSANKSIEQSAVKDIAGFLFPDTSHWEEEIAVYCKTPLEQHLEFSFRFYNALAQAAEYNLLKLEK